MSALDVITSALRRLGIVAVDEPVQAHDEVYARGVLEAVFDEAKAAQGLKLTFGLDDIPHQFVEPLALLLAHELAPTYSKPPLVMRSTALVRLRALSWPLEKRETDPAAPDDYGFSGYVYPGEGYF